MAPLSAVHRDETEVTHTHIAVLICWSVLSANSHGLQGSDYMQSDWQRRLYARLLFLLRRQTAEHVYTNKLRGNADEIPQPGQD